jgi:hypothetical protein
MVATTRGITRLDAFQVAPTARRADELARDEQRRFGFGDRPVPRPGQVCANRWIAVVNMRRPRRASLLLRCRSSLD